jgi:protein-disulfide isomerase
MAKKDSDSAPSKRQMIREQREKRQRQQRMITVLVVVAGALLVAAILILPSIRENATPVGEITTVAPVERPEADGTALGDPNAPVKVEVWEDFQCPACQGYSQQIEPEVVKNFVATGKAHYVFRHYPFIDDAAASKESDQSANASMCAAEQGRFWDYHDILYANWNGENEGAYSDKRLVAFAETIGLNMNDFNSCFDANKYDAEIQQDLVDGQQVGVTGTPSVFVNGKIIKPGFVPSYQDIAQAIEAEIASQ